MKKRSIKDFQALYASVDEEWLVLIQNGAKLASKKAQGCDKVISDIGSGLNCAKLGLRKLLKYLLSGNVRRLTVIQEDRLLRIGVGLIKGTSKNWKPARQAFR